MGFAELSIADIAAEYDLAVEDVFHLCDRSGITYKNEQTCLALEDAKAVIAQILSEVQSNKTNAVQ
ncbi:MAG: translation initiation factor IF-2 [Cyanophyceae cyanobacterium]